MTAPPPPAPAPGPPGPIGGPLASPDGPRLPAGAAAVGVALALALVVAFAARGADLWAPSREGRADAGSLTTTVLATALVTLVAGALVVAAVHRVVLSARPGAPTLRATLIRSAPLLVVAAAVLCLVAISWTRLEPEPSDDRTDPPSGPDLTTPSPGGGGFDGPVGSGDVRWRGFADLDETGTVVVGDVDGDGDLEIGIDTDGDGVADLLARGGDDDDRSDLDDGGALFVRCNDDGACVAAVDEDGDGEIDRRARVDDSFGELGAVDGARLVDEYGEIGEVLIDGDFDIDRDGSSVIDEDGDPVDQDDLGAPDDLTDEPDEPGAGALGRILGLVLGLGLAALAAVAVVALLRNGLGRRGGGGRAPGAWEPEPDQEAAREQMAASVVDSIDAMLRDPDPRTAIIGAYARLLEGLAASDVARLSHEAPVEHLQRALTSLSVRPEPLRQLLGLFELARFSTHPLGEADRGQALAALRAAADDLVATRPPPPPPVPEPVSR